LRSEDEGSKFQGKEENIMRYTKPSIVSLGAASSAIQLIGHGKPMFVPDNPHPTARPSSGGAYDLDE